MRSEDEDEFRRFTAARWAGLVRTAYLLTGDLGHAEDLAQTTLIKAYRSWHRVRKVEDVDAYVRKILINCNRSRFRAKRPMEYSVAAVPEHPVWTDADRGIEERDVLFAALAALPPRQRAIVVLRYWEDSAEGEVAELLGCSVGNVKSQASRALAKLRNDAGLAGLLPFRDPAAAKTKVVIYDDYRCPPCRQIDAGIGPTLQQEAASGQVQVEYLPVNLVDRNSATSGTGSVVAGNAVQCAAEHGYFYAYRAAVFAHQPQTDADDIFQSPAQLVAIAKTIPGLVTAEFVKCVDDLPYAAAIKRNYDAAVDIARCAGVPCISVDGQQWTNQGQGQSFNTWLMQKIAAS